MEKDTTVTLDGKERWYLSDETEQNGIKYFLALKMDENDEPTLKLNEDGELSEESRIFQEKVEGEKTYLVEVTDSEKLKYLVAIFITNFSTMVDELNEQAA